MAWNEPDFRKDFSASKNDNARSFDRALLWEEFWEETCGSADQAKISETARPLSPTVKGRPEGEVTTVSIGRPRPAPMVAMKS